MVPRGRIELPASPLPRVRSTTELPRRHIYWPQAGKPATADLFGLRVAGHLRRISRASGGHIIILARYGFILRKIVQFCFPVTPILPIVWCFRKYIIW